MHFVPRCPWLAKTPQRLRLSLMLNLHQARMAGGCGLFCQAGSVRSLTYGGGDFMAWAPFEHKFDSLSCLLGGLTKTSSANKP